MKKLFAVLALAFLSVSFAYAKASYNQEIIIKTGVQPHGMLSAGDDDYNTNVGLSLGMEYFKYINNFIAVGAGTAYDLPRKFQGDDLSGSISFLPVYAAFKIRPPLHGLQNNYGFASMRLGYSAFITNDADWVKSSVGGIYAAIGLGANLNVFHIEAVYALNNLSVKYANGSNKYKSESCSAITLYVGLKFE